MVFLEAGVESITAFLCPQSLLCGCPGRSWCYSEKSKRRTLQKEDIQTAIKYTEIFDFLVDVIQ